MEEFNKSISISISIQDGNRWYTQVVYQTSDKKLNVGYRDSRRGNADMGNQT